MFALVIERHGNTTQIDRCDTYIVSLEVINRLSVRGRKSRLYAEVIKTAQNTVYVTMRSDDCSLTRDTTPARRARRRRKTGAERGRLLQNCMREEPVSALLLPPSVSVVPDWNKFRQPLSLHTELVQSRGVASSTKSLNHAACGCRCILLLFSDAKWL